MKRLAWTVAGLVLALALVYLLALATTDRWTVSRFIVWQDADVDDWTRFPSRPLAAAPRPFEFETAPDRADAFPDNAIRLPAAEGANGAEEVDEEQQVACEGPRPAPGSTDGLEQRDLDEFLTETQTTAFVVVHGDTLIEERYYNGAGPDSIHTSFSVAKSFVSALVGAAIDDGHIGSLDDSVTEYVPELLERDDRFGQITLRHLITMSSGMRYEEPPIPLPWADDTLTYYGTDLRDVALTSTEVIGPPGEHFHYNNYNLLLLGLVLERATGASVSAYLEETLWQPLGMRAGSWSLDSTASGFEKMESGLNATALDYAKFGALYLNGGEWDGQQVLPREWVAESTRVDTSTDPAAGYQYLWWTDCPTDATADATPGGERTGFMARGNKGQFIYVSPEYELVIVRLGREFGYDRWAELLRSLAAQIGERL